MSAEPHAALEFKPLSQMGRPNVPKGYYRSKLFTAPVSCNPLVAAAGPLLSLLERLCVSPSLPPVLHIRNNIEHELHAFYNRIQAQHHHEDVQAMAYYLMCAMIDELIGKNYLRVHKTPVQFNAFTPASNQGNDPKDCFFEIVAFVKQQPHPYLDVIELAYYCLIAGFEGKHHEEANGRQLLDDLLEELYQLIQEHRADKTYHLFKHTPKTAPAAKHHRLSILTIGVSLSVLASGYWITQALLDHKAQNLQYSHHVLDHGIAHG